MRLRQIDKTPDLLLVLERGDEIPAVVRDVCVQQGVTTALVSGSGRASWLVLEGGPAGRRRVAGPLEVLHIDGTAEQRGSRPELNLRVVASREMDTGLEIVGGVMIEGLFEEATIRVTRHHHPGAVVPGAGGAVADASAPTWASVAAASAHLGDDDDEGEAPRVGDTVDHPKFGRCVVKGIDDDHIRIRKDGGRTVSLGLSHLRFALSGELSTGKRLFKIIVGKTR